MPTMTDYEHLTHNDKKILVDAAIRDGDGYNISGTYPKKVDIRARPGTAKTLRITHGLENAPSAVSLYVVGGTAQDEVLEKIEADISVTNQYIDITFTELPPAPTGRSELELLIRSLI